MKYIVPVACAVVDKIDIRISFRFNHNGLILQTYDDSMLPRSPDVNGILLRLKIELRLE